MSESLQKTLVGEAWNVTNEAIDRNRKPRILWSRLLGGKSIDAIVFELCYKFSPDEIIKFIENRIPGLPPEAKRRLKINVNSSFVRARKRRGL